MEPHQPVKTVTLLAGMCRCLFRKMRTGSRSRYRRKRPAGWRMAIASKSDDEGDRDALEYFHLEFDLHDVIDAEGRGNFVRTASGNKRLPCLLFLS